MEIHGNASVRARLSRAAADSRLHHCFVFEGPEGVGKFTYALQFAREINCQSTTSARPCGVCDPCRWIAAGTHPDVMVVSPDPEKATPIITAAQAREIVNSIQLQRHSANYRVIILNPADALNEEAANILLKTLEEPPARTQFILVTARPASLLQTVRSRSQRVRFGPLSDEEMAGWLAERGMDVALARAAAGSPGRAIALAGGEADTRREVLDALCGAVGQPLHALFSFCESTSKNAEGGGERAEFVLQILEELLADTVALANRRPLRHGDREQLIRRWVRGMWPDGVGRMQSEISLARDRLRLNVQARVALEALLAHLNLELSHVPA